MRIFGKIALLLTFVMFFAFCRKPTTASWDVDVSLPVVTSKLNIRNFLGDTVFTSDNSGLLHLAITRTMTAIKLDSLIKLPDTTIVTSFTLPAFNATLQPGQSLPINPISLLTFSIDNNASIEKVDIRSGKLKVIFSNDLAEPIDFYYTIPSASRNGVKFSVIETVPPGQNSLERIYDLSGYRFNMTGSNGSTYNTIIQNYTVNLSPTATGPASLTFGQGAKAKVSYSGIVPDYIEGYFGKQVITVPLDTTKLDILKNFEAANFSLSDASLDFKILNEFGVEFKSTLSNISSINGNSVVTLNAPQLANLHVNSATRSGNTVFPSAKTIKFIPANSNILPFLSNLPDKLTYAGTVSVNPLGNVSGFNDFAYYNTGIKVLADIDIPMRFSASYFKLVSTTKVDFSNIEQLNNVNSGKFLIHATNGYPFSAKLQAYLLDEQSNVIDSLFINGSNIIQKGQTDNQNIVVQSTRSSVEMPLNESRIANLKKCKNIRMVSMFLMPPSPPDIKIRENYEIDVSIVAELNYRAERK